MDNQENTSDLPEKGMWLVFLRREKLEGEEESQFDIFERKLQGVPYRNLLHLWAPPKSKNREGVIGFLTENVEDVLDIYAQGMLIRHALGDEASHVDLYYKPCTTGERQISIYRFSRKGVFYKRNPENRHIWQGLVWSSEELVDPEEMEDHSGLWLIKLSPETGGQDEESSRARALTKLLDAKRRGEVKLYSPSADYDLLVCSTEDDRNLQDIYLQGMVIRKILGDQAGDATMYYKTREMIRAGRTSEDCTDICEYRLSNMGVFSRRNRTGVGESWLRIETIEFEYSPQGSQVTP